MEICQYLIKKLDNPIIISNNNYFQFNPNNALYEPIEDINHIIFIQNQNVITNPLNKIIQKLRSLTFNNKEELENNEKKIKELIKLKKFYGGCNRISTIMKLTQKSQLFEKIDFEAKQKPYLLPVMNKKVLNLKNGKLEERTEKHYFTFEIKAKFDEDEILSKTKRADRFFNKLMKDDESKIDLLRQVLGSLITGEPLKYFYSFFGASGSNGKSALVFEILYACLGQYHRGIKKELILKRKFKSGGSSPELLELKGGRVGVSSEINEGEKVDEEMFKTLTSGCDFIEARNHYEKHMTKFINTSKPVILLNKPFYLDTTDNATKNRIINVEFNAEFKSNPKDGQYRQNPKLINYLKSPEGVAQCLSWICKGSMKFYKQKLNIVSPVLDEMKSTFLNRIDPVEGFMKRVRFGDYSDFYSRGDITRAFKGYLSGTHFTYNGKLRDKIYQEIEKKCKKVKNSVYGYRGLDINEDYEEDVGEEPEFIDDDPKEDTDYKSKYLELLERFKILESQMKNDV